tara:strand:+ start:306 stop:1274 length:969 start_codon:yes stop_codon:yes gene_type:complete
MATYKVGQKFAIESGKVKTGGGGTKRVCKVRKNEHGSGSSHSCRNEWQPTTYTVPLYEWNGSDWVKSNETVKGTKSVYDRSIKLEGGYKSYENVGDIEPHIDVTETDWGAANITRDDFIDEEGKPLPVLEVAKRLDPKFPNLTGEALILQIKDMFPKYAGVSAEDKQFAEQDMQKDIYGLQGAAREAGQAMQGAWAGGGQGMRASMGVQADLARGMKGAEQAHAKTMYGLEEAATSEFERDIEGVIDQDWFKQDVSGEKKLTNWDEQYDPLTGEEKTDFKQGGLVQPKKQSYLKFREGGKLPVFEQDTFLDFLTKLPDAGGS